MGRWKCDHIKRLITLTSDNTVPKTKKWIDISCKIAYIERIFLNITSRELLSTDIYLTDSC